MPPLGVPATAPVATNLTLRSNNDVLSFFDSGRGSSVPSKQSSSSIDLSDDNDVMSKPVRVEEEAKTRKRKFWDISKQLPVNDRDEAESDSDIEAIKEVVGEELDLEEETPTEHNKRVCIGVRPPLSVHPRSQYEGYSHPLSKDQERYVVRDLLVGD